MTCSFLVDGKLVRSQKVEDQGWVTFTTESLHHFRIKFQCKNIVGDPFTDPGFAGEIWNDADNGQKSSVTGQRYYPWGNALDKTNTKQMISNPNKNVSDDTASTARHVWENAAMNSLAMSMDLVGGQTVRSGHSTSMILYADRGDWLVGGVHVLCTLICSGVGAYFGNVLGAIVGGLGGGHSRNWFLDIRDDVIQGWGRKLKYTVEAKDLDVATLLDTAIQKRTNETDLVVLKDPDFYKSIKADLEGVYIRYARDELDDEIYDYKVYRTLWTRDFKETYGKALKEKFDNEVPHTQVESLIKIHVDRRLVGKGKIDLKNLGVQLGQAEIDRKGKLTALNASKDHPASSPEWLAVQRQIEDDYKKKAGELHEQMKDLGKDIDEREKRSTNEVVVSTRDEIDKSVKRKREDAIATRIRRSREGDIV